ncbi:MAG: GAF domain-containing protein [Anaerolineae bacterium]|nr:GAF domain-containing protein [Anaerolineae bacterium]
MDTVKTRVRIFHWVLGIGGIILAAAFWPKLASQNFLEWLVLGSSVLMVALLLYLSINLGWGKITFLPAAVMMIYLSLGLNVSLLTVAAGLLIGSLSHLVEENRRAEFVDPLWWQTVGRVLYPIGQYGIGLAAAETSYRLLGGSAPLTVINSLEMLLPAAIVPIAFLITIDAIIVLELWLRDPAALKQIKETYKIALAIQLLPMVLAPFTAITITRLGPLTFIIYEIIVMTLALVVRRLMVAQERLQKQVTRIRSVSVMNQAIRTSIDIDELLHSVYIQVASLMNVRNLIIVLTDQQSETREWLPRYLIIDGKKIEQPSRDYVDGFCRQVLDTQVTLVAESVSRAAARLVISRAPKARTWMGIPLLSSGTVIGCMATWLGEDQQPERTFNEADVDLLTTIAVQAEVAMQNALLYEGAQKHAAQLARLNQISALMNASLNPESLLELVTESLIEVAGCNKAAIYLLEQNKSDPRMLLTYAQGIDEAHINTIKESRSAVSENERKLILEEGTIITVSDIKDAIIDETSSAHYLAEESNLIAYAYVPLRAQNRNLGMLAVYYDDIHSFSESEIELLVTFANQAALAVTNARIYQQVDLQLARRIGQIVQMSDISQRLSATLDLEAIFKLIIDSAIDGCSADAGVLVLAGDPETGYQQDSQPHMVAWRGFDPANSTRAPHRIAEELAIGDVMEKGETRISTSDDPKTSNPRSQLTVPVLLEGKVIGAMALESNSANAFNQEDLSFVSQLAIQAAVAIRNAQLYRNVQVVRDRLHAILDTSNDGLLMIDPKMRIVMTNTRMGEFWDFARSDFVPRSPDQFIADPLSSLGEGLGYKEGELALLIKTGINNPGMEAKTDLYTTRPQQGRSQRYVERVVSPVRDERGAFIGLLLLFRDVTEQKELEEARQNLTSMIVHELRSPLQAVMGSMSLIHRATPEKDPVIEQATEVSQRAVKKLLNLVNNMLDVSRMEQGEMVLDTGAEEVIDIVKDVTEEIMPLAKEMNAMVNMEIPGSLPKVRVDRDMIERVAINLLDNALKYTDPGTLVSIGAELRPPEIGTKGPSDSTQQLDKDILKHTMVEVFVTDNGPGVPDEYKELIFDQFSQIPGRKGRRRSAGLGLSFCKLAIESHGGRIWVEDNPAGGSVFRFTLPVVGREDKAASDENALVVPKSEDAKTSAGGKTETETETETEAGAETKAETEARTKAETADTGKTGGKE